MRQLLVASELSALLSVLATPSPTRAFRTGRTRRGKVFRAKSAPMCCSISSAGAKRRAERRATGITVPAIAAILVTQLGLSSSRHKRLAMVMVIRSLILAKVVSGVKARSVRVVWTAKQVFEVCGRLLQTDWRHVVLFYTGGQYHKPRLGGLRAHARWGRFKASGILPPIQSAGGSSRCWPMGVSRQGCSWKRVKHSPQAWPRHNRDEISATRAANACEMHA